MSPNKRPTKLILEELEPRILFSADPFAAAGFSSVAGVSSEKHLTLSDEELSGLGQLNQQLQSAAVNGNTAAENPAKQRALQTVAVTLLASKDTYISEHNKGANYGAAGQIQIDISGGADLGKERIVLQFDLSSIPANATITSAELRMDATNHSASGTVTVNVHTLNQDWDEGTATSGNGQANWDDRQTGVSWASSGGDYAGTPVASSDVTGTGVHNWDLTATVQNWLNGSLQNRGVIIGSPQSGSDVFTYLSAEGSATSGPRLAVSYTVPNLPPTATRLNAAETYTEDLALNLSDIVISDPDDTTTTATLTLSNASAGSLNTATSGAVTSTYNPATGEWQASGAIADVNTLLADLTFTPEPDFDSPLSIATNVSDGEAPALTGTKMLSVTAVNDAPVIAALGGDVLIAENDGTAYLLDTNVSAVVTDIDAPANYAGAHIQVSGLGFDVSDQLGIDVSSGVALSAGMADGSLVSISGLDVGSLSSVTGSGFRIDFNASSTLAHIENVVRSLTFSTNSTVFGERSVDIVFDDGGGSSNGGSGSSATQAVSVYVAQAVGQQVNGLEDAEYTFTASDFDYTGITGSNLESITLLSLPENSGSNRGTLLYNGVPAVVGQIISRAEIDSGALSFLSDADDNGVPYAAFDFQVNNGKLNIALLSGEPDNEALLGTNWSGTNALLQDSNNFGLGGIYSSSLSLIANSTNIDAAYLAQGSIFVDGGVTNGAWSGAELSALGTWVGNGGILIVTADAGNADAVANHFGMTLGGQTAPTWQVSDSSHPVMNGPFGLVGSNGDPISNGGSLYAFFDPANLAPGDQVIATGSAGNSQPTMVLRQQGSGWILFTGDEGIFRGNISGGGVISTPNDILVANIFAWAAEQLPATDSYTMRIAVAPVNDLPIMVNNAVTINEGETLVLSTADISATDIDNPDSTLSFSVSAVRGGQFELASNPGVEVNIFSQAQLGAGDVLFVHNGKEAAPGFDISVGDGLATTALASSSISYTPVNDPPILTGLNGSATVADNSGTPVVVNSGATASLVDPDPPANYNGASLQINGVGFLENDVVGLDTSTLITLSSGLDDGSDVSISGMTIGRVSSSGPTAFNIVFNSNATGVHVEELLNNITFASTSNDFSSRSMSVAFNDGGGVANGGNDTSDAATAFIYLGSAGTGVVVGNEDSAYTFQASDFEFTGVPSAALQFIRVMAVPADGELILSGNPVTAGQRIERADIDAGNLQYIVEPNVNGSMLANLSVQINNGILSANILAGQPNSYTVGETLFANTDAILSNTNNFGLGGVSPTSLSIVSTNANVDAEYLSQGNIFFNGDPRDSQWSNDELVALDNWVAAGGVLISSNDSAGSDSVAEYFGLSIGGRSDTAWAVADDGSDIMNGPFGSVGPNGSVFSAAGNQHSYFASASLAPGDTVLAVDSATAEPTLVVRQHGAGAILFSGDEGVFRANTSGGGVIATANDRLIANTFAWAIAQLPNAEQHVLNIALNPVNDAPTATGLNSAESYLEDTSLDLSNIIVDDIDSSSISVTLTLSEPAAGALTTATIGAVTSVYDEINGVWSVSGDIAAVNTLLANLEFVPTENFNTDFEISTSVSDGAAPALIGTKSISGSAVNDAPVGTVTLNNAAPIEGDRLLAANTLSDVDGMREGITYQWLRGGAVINGATDAVYIASADDIGSQLTVVARYTDDDGTPESVSSEATKPVLQKNRAASVNLSQSSVSLAEYPRSAERVRLAEIEIVDDGIGQNTLMLSGADADYFEIENGVLYLKANSLLDYETATKLEVSVVVDDTDVPGSVDDSKTFKINVIDIDEAALVANQANAASTEADGTSTISDSDTELSVENIELTPLSIASSISDDLQRGLLPGATREFDTDSGAGQTLDVLVNGIDASAHTGLQGIGSGEQQTSTQTVDLAQLLQLDSPEIFVDPISMLGEMKTVDPMEGFSLLDNTPFQNGLDDMRRQILGVDVQDQIVIGSTVSVTTGVSIGYVLWLIRGSVLLSTVLSSLPAWRLIDPLPVISGMLNEDEDDESLESIIEDSEAEQAAKNTDDSEQPD